MTKAEVLQELENKIAVVGTQNETECTALLTEASYVLLPTEQGQITYVNTEQTVHPGRIDLLVYADCAQASGARRRTLYVWELKAPQLSLFRIDTNNRARPSAALYDAENQLVHYHDSLRDNGSFRGTHKILAPDDVKFGGIIIGRSSNYVWHKAKIEADRAHDLAEQALRLRQRLFYDPHGIRIWTWDTIVQRMRVMEQSFTDSQGDASAVIDVTLPLITIEAFAETA